MMEIGLEALGQGLAGGQQLGGGLLGGGQHAGVVQPRQAYEVPAEGAAGL